MRKKCKHKECIRPAETNARHGFCDQCIQLNSRACNYCLHKDGKIDMGHAKQVDTEHRWDSAKDVVGIILFVCLAIFITLVVVNNVMRIPPSITHYENGTRYECSAVSQTIANPVWDLHYHPEYLVSYIIGLPFIMLIMVFIIAILFGHIPICGGR